MANDTLNISDLAPPDYFPILDFEAILAKKIAVFSKSFKERTGADYLPVESDPVMMALELSAAEELNLLSQFNTTLNQLLTANSRGNGLDNLGVRCHTERLEDEEDDRYRNRQVGAFDKLAAAGPGDAYDQHAMDVDALIKDVKSITPTDGQVLVSVLAPNYIADEELPEDEVAAEALKIQGAALFPELPEISGKHLVLADANSDIIQRVRTHLHKKHIKPLTDILGIQPANVVPYFVEATLTIFDGPDHELVRQQAEGDLLKFVSHKDTLKIGRGVSDTDIKDALKVGGIRDIDLKGDFDQEQNIEADDTQVAVCVGVSVTIGGD